MEATENNLNEPLMITPTLDKEDLLEMIAPHCPDAERQGDWLLIRKHMLRLTIEFGEMRCVQGAYAVQLLFIAQHPWFDEDMVESVMGFGGSADEAMRKGTMQFCSVVLQNLLMAFDAKSGTQIEADVMGKKHIFRLPAARAWMHLAEGNRTDLYEIVQDMLPEYLGTKRCYWVSLSSEIMDGTPICKVTVNGMVCNRLTELLYKEAVQRLETIRFSFDREFLLLIQNEETWKPCPFTKQEVGELVFRSIRLMQEIHDEVSSQQISHAIRNGAPERSLGKELVAFIPEVICQTVVQFMDNDGLMPVVNFGKPDVELKKTQVRSYGYIEDAVFQYLNKQNPTEDEVNQLLAMSKKFQVLSEAIENKTKLEDLKMSQLVYFVDETYKVW